MGISGSVEDTSYEDAAYLMNVNFMGVFNSTKAMIPLLRKSGGGKILNMSSVAARLGIPFQAFYSSSKAAINAFSEALNIELHPFKIQVCSIMPGDIKTGFTKNRKKNEVDSVFYKKRVDKSVSVMEEDERNGMDPEYAAKVVLKLIERKRIPLYKTIGFKYKIFVLLHKFLPAKLANNVVGMIYGFKKEK
jgi:short-subunit dehydrogenase